MIDFQSLHISEVIKLIMKGLRTNSSWHTLFDISLKYMNLEVGYSIHHLSVQPPNHLLSQTWLRHLWDTLSETMCSLKFQDKFNLRPQRLNDVFIMKGYNINHWSPIELRAVNTCRMYLKAITISDITRYDVITIDSYFLSGK